jgi:Alpha/beta hydrolase domain
VLSYTPAHRAAFHCFHEWLRGGSPPPEMPRIEFDAADPPAIARDPYGNALGGIRLPDFDVPTGEHIGTGKGDVLASLVGFSRPFSPAELAELYPNREAYLGRWHAALAHGVDAGFVLPEDAPAMKAVADEAAATVFPK